MHSTGTQPRSTQPRTRSGLVHGVDVHTWSGGSADVSSDTSDVTDGDTSEPEADTGALVKQLRSELQRERYRNTQLAAQVKRQARRNEQLVRSSSRRAHRARRPRTARPAHGASRALARSNCKPSRRRSSSRTS